uniref:Leptin n=1 Tax=Monopterus albus TaxID=43700 RepID=A0A3Q3JDE4_MONAL|nr:leptin-B-like [Monopterus albus]
MRILLVLFSVSLVISPGHSHLSAKGDSITNAIHNIINIARITLVHIQKLWTKMPVAPQIYITTPSIEGLTNISHDLGLLDNELLSPVTELLSQIQADVSSLEGRVRSLALTMDCPIQPRSSRSSAKTSDDLFPDSHLYLTLTKVQHYLETLILNKDKLSVC